MKTVARFSIGFTRHLLPDGSAAGQLPEFARDPETLLALYRAIWRTRLFDERAVKLQRTGRLGTYASSLGQEAVSVAIGHAMRSEDVLVPMYRDYGTQLQRGVRMSELLLYWGGDERGMYTHGEGQDLPISVPVASHAPHAAGVAYAFRLRREPRVAVCTVGDGATSKGDFYEALNAAGTWRLPLVFVVVNNQWAISVPRAAQSGAGTLAQKAIAAGVPGEQVDGNDVIAARERIAAALENARNGGGPALIEALTYRLCDHTTADDASRYRDKAELEARRHEEPLVRLRRYLFDTGVLSEAVDQRIREQCDEEVEMEAGLYLETEPLPPHSLFDHLYAELPSSFRAQRDALRRRGSPP
ncbi:MAG: pyruvate dehydrogenase (acetyl-transferring) E1 component subunit alpha [Pseudomonadota bacterium]|nr:pyruvate dehydrogenase (acetyl-transferring) E1 component subunit alpha [Pseudomonadota bacterium]